MSQKEAQTVVDFTINLKNYQFYSLATKRIYLIDRFTERNKSPIKFYFYKKKDNLVIFSSSSTTFSINFDKIYAMDRVSSGFPSQIKWRAICHVAMNACSYALSKHFEEVTLGAIII